MKESKKGNDFETKQRKCRWCCKCAGFLCTTCCMAYCMPTAKNGYRNCFQQHVTRGRPCSTKRHRVL